MLQAELCQVSHFQPFENLIFYLFQKSGKAQAVRIAAKLTLHHKDKPGLRFTAPLSIQNELVLDYSPFKTKHEWLEHFYAPRHFDIQSYSGSLLLPAGNAF